MFDRRAITVVIVLAIACVLPAYFTSIVTAAQFEDAFEDFDPVWGEPNERRSVQDGVMVLKPNPGKIEALLYQGNFFDDIDLSVKMRKVAGEANAWGSGPLFWAASFDEYYMLTVASSGRFAVQRKTRGKWLTPVSWRDGESIKKGPGEWNELRVVTHGPEATIYINGTEMLTFTGHPPEGGSFIGLEADSAAEEILTWEFDDLKVE